MNLVAFGGVLGYGGMEAAWKDSRLSPSSVSLSRHQPSGGRTSSIKVASSFNIG
jgi:hypothetical protein